MGNNSKPDWAHLRLTDAIEPGVRVLLVGINPGVMSAGMGHRDDEPVREAKSRHRRSESAGIPRGLENSREEDRALPTGDRSLRGRDDVSRALAGPGAGCSWLAEAQRRRRLRHQAGIS